MSISDKPLAYLDHNVLDMFVKERSFPFFNVLKENFRIVYSDETLKEIKRSTGHSEKFLKVLKKLDAAQIKVVVDDVFDIKNEAIITDRDVFDAYNEYCEDDTKYEPIQMAQEQWLLKFFGGRSGDSISDINAEQLKAFNELLFTVEEDLEALADEAPELVAQMRSKSSLMRDEFARLLKASEAQLKAHIENEREWSGVMDFRNAMKLGPIEIQNIKPPKVIWQIWECFLRIPAISEAGIKMEDFFCISRNPVKPEQPPHAHQKAGTLYHMLNVVGYFPDKGVSTQKGFTSSISDQGHAAIATFCHVIFSCDRRFVRKLRAVYEFLDLSTEIILVELNREKTSRSAD